MLTYNRYRRRRAGTAAALALLCTGCRSYVPVVPGQLAPGTTARVTLTDRGSVELARSLGPRGELLEGRVMESGDSALVLAVSTVVRQNGVEESWTGERLLVPQSYVASTTMPKLSTWRSVLLTGGVLAGLAAIAAAIEGSNDNVVKGPAGGGEQPR
jgi:hypothetical protein